MTSWGGTEDGCQLTKGKDKSFLDLLSQLRCIQQISLLSFLQSLDIKGTQTTEQP